MSDGITVTPGSGRLVHADVTTLNGQTGLVQLVKIHSAVDGSTNKLSIHSDGAMVSYVTNLISVSGTMTVTSSIPGTGATNLGKAEDAAHTSGDTGVMLLAVREAAATDLSAGATDGDYEPLQVDALGRLWVRVGASDVGSTTDTDDGTVAAAQASLAVVISEAYRYDGTNWVRPVAHDAVDNSGSPYKIGARAETSPKGITLVADGDVTHLYADSDGIQLVKLNTSWGDLISERISNTDGASTAFSTFDNAAGTHNFITSVTVHNAHATTNGYVDFRDGTAGSVIWTFPLPATGGTTHNFNPPLRQPTAATALAYDVSAAITTIYISVNGFKSKV